MFYVGIDVHSKQMTVCVLDENGKVDRRMVVRQVDQLQRELSRLPGRYAVCYEASCGYGWVHDLLHPLASRVVVAHPGGLKAIYGSKRKNDRRDAELLAKLLYLDAVPAVHVPSIGVRCWRELITFRRRLVEKRTRAKNGLRALLRTAGIQAPKRPGLWTLEGMTWLKALSFAQPMHALKRDVLVDEIESLSTQIQRVEKELDALGRESVAVQQLRSIPGVGPRTAEAVVAFLDDPRRFRNAKAVGSYVGLVPAQDQSGDKNRLGHITRNGSATVRHLLVEAVWQAARRSPTIGDHMRRVQRDDPRRKKIAVVATAHYLIRAMWAMLRDGTLWKETAIPAADAA